MNYKFICRRRTSSARIQSRLEDIVNLWETLVQATDKKSSKLQEASQQQQYNRTIEDIELWLSEIEGQLMSEDYGKVIKFLRTINTLQFEATLI